MYIEEKYPKENKSFTGVFEKSVNNEFWKLVNKKSLDDQILKQMIKNYKKFNVFKVIVVIDLIIINVLFN